MRRIKIEACDCASCRARLHREFARVLDASYEWDELIAVLNETNYLVQQIGEGNLSEAAIARIRAYSGPLPDVTA